GRGEHQQRRERASRARRHALEKVGGVHGGVTSDKHAGLRAQFTTVGRCGGHAPPTVPRKVYWRKL
ncbi:MAG TPA: hypothetical protein VLB06_07860, partial [Sulfuricaulis sp.]|nr:hypothetical protein [Sulfuricaulis sp.]